MWKEILKEDSEIQSALILSWGKQYKENEADFDENRGTVVGNQIMKQIIKYKRRLNEIDEGSKQLIFISCYEIIANGEEEVVDLINCKSIFF